MNKVLAYLNAWRFLPHYCLYLKHRKIIDKDLQRAQVSSSIFFQLYKFRDFRALFFHRCAKDNELAVKILAFFTPPIIDLYIRRKCTIGPGCLFIHCHAAHINAESIGDNFKCFHLVTIGANENTKSLPVIGNNVSVYTGAVIVDGIRIGNNVKIGANSVVTKNVPDNCTVIGNPAYIVKLNGKKCHISL